MVSETAVICLPLKLTLMGILKTRKNKKFDYEPRYFKHDGEGSPYQIRHRFDEHRSTVGDTSGLKNKVKSALADLRRSSDRNTSRRLVIIVAVLVFLFLLLIDFDLSIFYQG